MVHSGPFNGLCEIESSRGSPGISNIFLPMLQLLRTTPVVPHPSFPLTLVRRLLSLFLSLLSICLLALPPNEGGPLAASRRISLATSLPAEDTRRISEFHSRYAIIETPTELFRVKLPLQWKGTRCKLRVFTLPSFSPKSNAKFERDHVASTKETRLHL